MTIPPHIPLGEHESREVQHGRSPLMYIATTLVVGALSGFIAGLLYTAYGPSTAPAQSLQAPALRVADTLDESQIKNTQESVVAFTGDKADQIISYGTAITGDGWFLAPASAAKAKHILMHPQTTGSIEKIVADPASGFVFVKTTITNARLLAYGSFNATARGTKLAIVLPHTAIPVTLQDMSVCVTDHCPSEYGDKISYAAGIVEAVPQYVIDGAPVETQQGELVGLAMHANNRVIVMPIEQMRSVFASVFSAGTAARAALPLRVTNLTRWSVFDPTGQLPEQGMLVESAAGVPQLKEGDVISMIENQRIEADTVLFDLVNRLRDQGHVTMTVLRKGASVDVTVPIKQ